MTKKKILLSAILLISIFTFGISIYALKRNPVYHIGILSGVEHFASTIDAFKSEMTKLGYTESKNIIYDVRRLNDDPDQEKAISEEFVKNKADLIFAFPTEAALSAKKAVKNTKTSVVFAWTPIENTGLVKNSHRPGGNITGVRHNSTELLLKTYEILREIAPDAKRIWLIYDPKIAAAAFVIKKIRPIAQSTGIKLIESSDIYNLDGLKITLKKRDAQSDPGVDAVMLLPSAVVSSPKGVTLIADWAKKRKIPLAGLTSDQVGLGVLFGYGPTVSSVSAVAASQADKILTGEVAGKLHVITVDGLLKIDNRVAREIGLEIPKGMYAQAAEILR